MHKPFFFEGTQGLLPPELATSLAQTRILNAAQVNFENSLLKGEAGQLLCTRLSGSVYESMPQGTFKR